MVLSIARAIRRRGATALAAACVLALATPGGAHAATGPLTLGFSDNAFVTATGPATMDMAARAGGRLIRLYGPWSAIARSRPADERNPADPAYDFAALDAAVRTAAAKRMQPFVMVTSAPAWAEGPGRPPTILEDGPDARATAGSWKPDVTALRNFATALARRYSGNFRPAGATRPLPRVRRFQAWNEPNMNTYLAPQWERTGSGLRAYAPGHYRRMLNAFTSAVKAVKADNLAITAGTSPYGNPAGQWRRRPLAFWRDALCVSAACGDRARFDVLAHHPYGSPVDDSFSADDLPVRGMPRLVALLRTAEKRRRVATARAHRVWVTELGIETSPPDPDGVSLAVQENYLQLSLYLLWRAGVDTVTWFQVIDERRGPGYPLTVQAGLYLSSGKAKRAARAYAFPFATDPDRPSIYWGLAPARGVVRIERRAGRRWVLVRRVTARPGRPFTGRGPWEPGTLLRARQGSRTSLIWRAL